LKSCLIYYSFFIVDNRCSPNVNCHVWWLSFWNTFISKILIDDDQHLLYRFFDRNNQLHYRLFLLITIYYQRIMVDSNCHLIYFFNQLLEVQQLKTRIWKV
jgi:hypothetical protein